MKPYQFKNNTTEKGFEENGMLVFHDKKWDLCLFPLNKSIQNH